MKKLFIIINLILCHLPFFTIINGMRISGKAAMGALPCYLRSHLTKRNNISKYLTSGKMGRTSFSTRQKVYNNFNRNKYILITAGSLFTSCLIYKCFDKKHFIKLLYDHSGKNAELDLTTDRLEALSFGKLKKGLEEDTDANNPFASLNGKSYKTFLQIKKIAKIWRSIIIEAAGDDPLLSSDDERIISDLNPFCRQTKQGFFLEFKHGRSEWLWTPWGKLKFDDALFSSGDFWSEISQNLLAKLEVELYMPEKNIQGYGCVGPIYKIKSIAGEPLPEPEEQADENYIKSRTAKEVWNLMEEKYTIEREIIQAWKLQL